MAESVRTEALKRKLQESLGVRKSEYAKRVSRWFSMKQMHKSELQQSLAGFLSAAELSLHNEYIKMLVRSCLTPISAATYEREQLHNVEKWQTSGEQQGYFSPEASKIPRMSRVDRTQIPTSSEQDSYHQSSPTASNYHPAFQGDRSQAFKDQPPLMIKEGALLSPNMMLERIYFGAYELDLEEVSPESAEYLCIATQFFIKNILTSIICRRKGFKVKYNKFVCGIGSAQLNPWLRNVSRGKNDYFHPLRVDKTQGGHLAPNPRPSREFAEQNSVFELVTRESDAETLAPITLMDLALTLKMHPSLVASNFVRTVNWERLLSRIHHPTWDS